MNSQLFKTLTSIPCVSHWMEEQLRSPSKNNPLGWMAQSMMSNINKKFATDIAERALKAYAENDDGASSQPYVVMEWGPGNGDSLQVFLDSKKCGRIYGVEISELFRDILKERFYQEMVSLSMSLSFSSSLSLDDDDSDDKIQKKEATLSIHPSLKVIEDYSIDIFTALNVIYFLNPLPAYLRELRRCCKPGALIIFGASEVAKKAARGRIFVNTDWDVCLKEMEKAGFENVHIETVEHNGIVMNYLSGRAGLL